MPNHQLYCDESSKIEDGTPAVEHEKVSVSVNRDLDTIQSQKKKPELKQLKRDA